MICKKEYEKLLARVLAETSSDAVADIGRPYFEEDELSKEQALPILMHTEFCLGREVARRFFNEDLDNSEASIRKLQDILLRIHKSINKKKDALVTNYDENVGDLFIYCADQEIKGEKVFFDFEETLNTIVFYFSGVLGAIILKNIGGKYIFDYTEEENEESAEIAIDLGAEFIVRPLGKVMKNILNGTEDNVDVFYGIVKAMKAQE